MKRLINWKRDHVRKRPLLWCTAEFVKGLIIGLLIYHYFIADRTKGFPKHWGDPPAIQTKDYRPLPCGYGHGSSTLYYWILRNGEKDSENKAQKKP